MSGNGIKRKREDEEDTHASDDMYFRSYGDISIHQDMIADEVRTSTYRRAILTNYEHIYGKVVVDVGAGTGILSMFCVQAGARRVYAIEASEVADEAQLVIKANGMDDRITIIHDKVENVELPEKVDVIVSEWMGYLLVYESMLSSVLFARDKWLKQDGLILPEIAEIYLAPVTDSGLYEDRLAFWDCMQDRYKVDMSALKPYARRCLTRAVHIEQVMPEDVMARPALVSTLDLRTCSTLDLKLIENSFSFDCFGETTIFGFVAWFKVIFSENITLSTSPYDDATHWQQSVLYVQNPMSVQQGDIIDGHLRLKPNSINARFLDVSLKHSLNKEPSSEADYEMNDFMGGK